MIEILVSSYRFDFSNLMTDVDWEQRFGYEQAGF
ncbi:hypothetical protein PEPS_36620 (plasmid) [Persicobacter psychrovividus]|uniref:Uncharacterized protein n=1 Tax=Persicobacter psychrovividus TaxID=387638 RepID=A0ABM7VK67_9BACT|nr:hypothetical protein PEPS_36620 [Persicobacter psychrovividus]